MLVIKFGIDEIRALENHLSSLKVPNKTIPKIVKFLIDQEFEIVQGWTEERIARSLFEYAEADFDDYGLGVTKHLPQGFLGKCLEYCDSMEIVYPDCLDIVFEAIALKHYVEEIHASSWEDIHYLVARQWDITDRPRLDHEVSKWLTHIVEEAIELYTSPIVIGIYGAGGHFL